MKEIREYYKIYLHDELPHMPRPLFLCRSIINQPYDLRDFRNTNHYYIFKYTLSGCGLFCDRVKKRELPSGYAVLLKHPADQCYTLWEPGMEQWDGIYLEFAAGNMEKIIDDWIAANGSVYELFPNSEIVKRLLSYIEQAQICRYGPMPEGQNLVYRGNIGIPGVDGVQLIFRMLAELSPCAVGTKSQSVNIVNAFCDYVNVHVESTLVIGQIAQKLTVSRGHLTRVFTDKMGITPNDYIVRSKIRLACQLLTVKEMTNKAIAEKIGLSSEFYFYRLFKQITGLTPREFRISNHREEIIQKL